MSARRTNLGLLALLALALATGLTAYAVGTTPARVVVAVHGIVGLGVMGLARPKSAVIRRGVRRRPWREALPSVVFGVLVVVVVVSGILRTAGLVLSYGPLDDMQVHVGAAVVAVPFGLWHIARRPARFRPEDLSRRNLLRTGILLGVFAGVYGGIEALYRVARAPGARRRFTGSFETGSHVPDRMPVTQWFDDDVPDIDAETWNVTVAGADGTHDVAYGDLTDATDRITATLDCTGGWYAEQHWRGVRLDRLVAADGRTRSIVVESATGYRRRLPVDDLPRLLLATHADDAPLSRGHGFPARLVAPGRRGFWWVKWVTRIEASPRPWWWQPPFPLT